MVKPEKFGHLHLVYRFTVPLKWKFLRFLSAWVKICWIPYANFEMTSQFYFKFGSFFIVIKHNSPVGFKLMHFLFCIKGSNESPNFENFVCSGEDLPNSSSHFPNHKSAFLQVFHHSLVSWNIAPLYFFSSKIIYFGQKQPKKV